MASRFSVIEGVVVFMGGVALILALIGIYGVAGFAVLRRTKELGIRLALGATTSDLLRTVIGPGLRPIIAGAVMGTFVAIGASLGLQRVFQSSPISIQAMDPLLYTVVSALLMLAAIAAMLIPGLKAARANPAQSLRED
jgi:ABC-type antimicrobial peptide transport system permease subunit